jgi:hypothetical protein
MLYIFKKHFHKQFKCFLNIITLVCCQGFLLDTLVSRVSDNRTDHTTLWGSTFCSPSLQGIWCGKNVTLNHAKAWQLIVNEFPSNAKALNLLHFLKKIKAYA